MQNKFKETNNSKAKLLNEIRKLNDKFDQLQSDVSITKNVNNLLSSRLVQMKRQCWADAQDSRRECLDIVGIPSEVKDKTLGESVVGILDKLGCSIDAE